MSASSSSWKPGQSGNPGGRPKKRDDLQDRCTAAVDEHVVKSWINEVIEKGPMWVECSKLLAGYAYGKPSQHIEHGGSLTLEQLVAGSYEKG